MGAFYTGDAPYDLNTWLDNLGIYTLDPHIAGLLDNAREIIDSGKYYFLGVPFPGSSFATIAAYDTFSGNITVPPLSYIMSITGDAVEFHDGKSAGRSQAGFKLRMYDKGAKMDVVVNSQFGNNGPFVGLMDTQSAPANPTNRPIGPMFPMSPMVILEPGSLQVEVTNLNDTYPCYVQVMIQLAVPINRVSANEQIVKQVRVS